jgi:hypothetical protein
MDATVDVFNEKLKKTEATDLEENPEKTESETEHEEVSKEKAAVESVRALKEWN